MKRFVVAVLAFVTVAIVVAPDISATKAAELPSSGTLTWSLPLDLG